MGNLTTGCGLRVEAGYRLTLHNWSRAVFDNLAVEGAVPVNSLQGASEAADLVITMLPADRHVVEVIFGG
jgi:3-hydroxyisobutyrate dehydrogenase-like beta-hydroxyacid dehydrogenase